MQPTLVLALFRALVGAASAAAVRAGTTHRERCRAALWIRSRSQSWRMSHGTSVGGHFSCARCPGCASSRKMPSAGRSTGAHRPSRLMWGARACARRALATKGSGGSNRRLERSCNRLVRDGILEPSVLMTFGDSATNTTASTSRGRRRHQVSRTAAYMRMVTAMQAQFLLDARFSGHSSRERERSTEEVVRVSGAVRPDGPHPEPGHGGGNRAFLCVISDGRGRLMAREPVGGGHSGCDIAPLGIGTPRVVVEVRGVVVSGALECR